MWVGVAIVAVSIVAGARILGTADDSVTLWAAAHDLAPGVRVDSDDLVAISIRFSDDSELRRYLRASDALPDDRLLTRGLGAGELLPQAALGASDDAQMVIVSLAFAPELIPTNIGTGSVIELLVIPDDGADENPNGRAATAPLDTVLSDVVVIDAPSGTDSLGTVSRGRQLVLGIPESRAGALAEILAASEDQRVRVLVRG